MSPASVQPHIPSFPAIAAKTKAEGAALEPCRMCWGVQSWEQGGWSRGRNAVPEPGAGGEGGSLFPPSPG